VSNGRDCGDTDPEVRPGAAEVCNDGLDNDCSGEAEGCAWPSVVELEDQIELTPADTSGTSFGCGIDVADLDGDGEAELLIAASGAAPVGAGSRGAMFVFELPISATRTTTGAAAWRARGADLTYIGQRMAVGDLDGDGYADAALSSVSATASGFGSGVVVTALGPIDPGGGAIEDAFDGRLYGEGDREHFFGRMLSVVGDVTGDGIADLMVGVEGHGVAHPMGAVLLLAAPVAGSRSAWDTAPAVITGEDSDTLGWCLSGGDVTGDGLNDVVVGAPYRNGSGEALLFYGPIAGEMPADDADVAISGRAGGAELGKGCAMLGDSNEDGYADVGLGASADGFGWSGVFAEGFSRPRYAATDATAQLLGTAGGSAGYFGASIHSAGDLNQDGVPDLVVGEVQWDPLAARVWFGPVAGVEDDTDADVTLWLPYDDFGGYLRHMHGGADLTGDTVPDLLISDELRDAGRVWLVPGVGF
jgi:hypothetical protein